MKYNVRTREVILEASVALFLKNGYFKTTSRAIAAAADVNVALINYYFESKLNLAKEVHDLLLADLYAQVDLSEYKTSNAIEKLYLTFLLVQEKVNQMEGFLTFHLQLLSEGDFFRQTNMPSWNNPLIDHVLEEEKIAINDFDKRIFKAMRSGAEFALLKAKIDGELDLDYLRLNEYLIYNISSYLGIEKEKVKISIAHVNTLLKPEIYQHLK